MTKHYVEFMYAGSFFSESSLEEIKSRDAKIKMPKGAYSYTIYDREEIKTGKETLTGKLKNPSKIYIIGEVYDIERVKKEVPDSRILVRNMECNKWDKVIKCLQGFVPFTKNHILIK